MADLTANTTATSDAQKERALIERLLAGEEWAFEEMVRLHGPRMLASARRLLGNEEDARDAVQEALLSAFRAMGSFKGESRLGTWLHRIVINAALLKLRQERRHRREINLDDLMPRFRPDGHPEAPAVSWDDHFLKRAETEEMRRQVRGQIDQLPDTHRNVLLLRDIEGLDTRQTAELLDINENAVKARLHRARQALRTLLDELFRGEAA